ncbi:retrovirus-related Pol polyprotein from transposon TNT 1-94 [Trifolium pratense]|uniref:Retrovirus-related Pol polyprotein from transposon TNT 1-94 n=1 Tax=Trifolium pratense TaxID=57577 RepID=A0A2K3JXT3_TRIPR|nr:retrovirus-related Pol polyprotein from transposon TNT 1-94 [Trifolium pratense]
METKAEAQQAKLQKPATQKNAALQTSQKHATLQTNTKGSKPKGKKNAEKQKTSTNHHPTPLTPHPFTTSKPPLSRPDITLATKQLSQFLNSPTVTHYKTACRVIRIRYLKHNPGRGLMFPRHSDKQILGYVDADWAGCVDYRRSTTGFSFI